MKHQQKAYILENESTQPSKFRTKNCVEVNDQSIGTYSAQNIKFKTTTLKSSPRDYSDAYIFVRETTALVGRGAHAAAIADDRKKEINNF